MNREGACLLERLPGEGRPNSEPAMVRGTRMECGAPLGERPSYGQVTALTGADAGRKTARPRPDDGNPGKSWPG